MRPPGGERGGGHGRGTGLRGASNSLAPAGERSRCNSAAA